MKKLLLLIGLLLAISSVNAQVVKFGELTKKGYYVSYVGEAKHTYNIGDTIRVGVPMKGKYNFTHIKKWNNPIVFGQGGRANHQLVIIGDMQVKGNVLTGYHMKFITTYPMSIFDYYLIVDIEKALKAKEILW